MTESYKILHPKFKLNGVVYTRAQLKELTYDLIKEGKPFQRAIGDFLLDWLDENSEVKVNTSGSTGVPKTIVLKKQQMVNSALATGSFFSLVAGDSALLCLPAEFIAGKMMLVRAMVLGLELDCFEPTSNPLLYSENKFDFCAMVPLQLENSLPKIEQIATLIVGGTAVAAELKSKVQNKTTQVYETYGMTETITHIAVRSINAKTKNTSENYFQALPDVVFSMDDRGCLVIDAPNVCDTKMVTNDLINRISDVEFEWIGRFDNVINSGGVKLFPEEIEKKLAGLIENQFFIAGLEDETLGQKLIFILEGETAIDKLKEAINNNPKLKRFEIPKTVYQLPHFVRTNNGKINRKETLKLIQG